MKNKWWYFLALGLIIVDMLSKYFTDGLDISDTNVFVNIVSVHNIGASWGILAGQRILFIILAVLFVGGMLCYDFLSKQNNRENGWFFIGYNFILAGIVGNLIDRIFLGYVRDFISLAFMQFPVFNVADMCLTIGTVCIVVWLLFFYGKKSKNTKENNLWNL